MMLPPHELKTKKFSKTFHGYSPDEVDDQIAFLLEQYADLYRENDELDRKLKLALAQIDSYKGDEESIRSALVGAQKAGDKILNDANERAEILLSAAKQTCGRMINETAVQIRRQQQLLNQLRAQAAAFKETILAQYAAQQALIEQTADSELDTELTEFADEELVRAIIAGIKDEVASKAEESLPASKRKARTASVRSKVRTQGAVKPIAEASAKEEAAEQTEDPVAQAAAQDASISDAQSRSVREMPNELPASADA